MADLMFLTGQIARLSDAGIKTDDPVIVEELLEIRIGDSPLGSPRALRAMIGS